MQLMHAKLSYEVVGCAMAVHRGLGPGLGEDLYHEALCRALSAAGIPYQFKPSGKLVHRGCEADEFEADLIVDQRIVVELKALPGPLAPVHLAQIICYQKFWRLDLGILMDFGKESLIQQRVLYTPVCDTFSVRAALADQGAASPAPPVLAAVADAVQVVHDTYGLGYRDTTYQGLLLAELTAGGIPCSTKPVTSVGYSGRPLGEAELDCVVVGEEAVLKVTALHDRLRAADRAAVQSYLKHLGLEAGLLLNFGKRSLEVRRVWV